VAWVIEPEGHLFYSKKNFFFRGKVEGLGEKREKVGGENVLTSVAVTKA